MDVIVPLSTGAALVLILDVCRKFLGFEGNKLKALSAALAFLFGTVIYASQNNPDLAVLVQQFLTVLGTSQALYSLIWRDSELHKNLIK